MPKASSIKLRPNTSVNRSEDKSDIRFSTFYDQQKTTPNKAPHRHFRTEASDGQDLPFSRVTGQQTEDLGQLSRENISLG
jgi:hypothetical protein